MSITNTSLAWLFHINGNQYVLHNAALRLGLCFFSPAMWMLSTDSDIVLAFVFALAYAHFCIAKSIAMVCVISLSLGALTLGHRRISSRQYDFGL